MDSVVRTHNQSSRDKHSPVKAQVQAVERCGNFLMVQNRAPIKTIFSHSLSCSQRVCEPCKTIHSSGKVLIGLVSLFPFSICL